MKKTLILFSLLITSTLAKSQNCGCTQTGSNFENYPKAVAFLKGFKNVVNDAGISTFKDLYCEKGAKTLFSISAGAVVVGKVSGSVYLDLNDLLLHTIEGKEGYVTCYLDIGLGLGVKASPLDVGVGISFADMTSEYDDPRRNGSFSAIAVEVPFIPIEFGTIEFEGSEAKAELFAASIDPSEFEAPTNVGITFLNINANLIRGEIRVSAFLKYFEDAIENNSVYDPTNKSYAFTSPSVLRNICTDVLDSFIKDNRGLIYPEYVTGKSIIRPFTLSDCPKTGPNMLGIKGVFTKDDLPYFTPVYNKTNTETEFKVFAYTDNLKERKLQIQVGNVPNGWQIAPKGKYHSPNYSHNTFTLGKTLPSKELASNWVVKHDNSAKEVDTVKFYLVKTRDFCSPCGTEVSNFTCSSSTYNSITKLACNPTYIDSIQVLLSKSNNNKPKIVDYDENIDKEEFYYEFSTHMNPATFDGAVYVRGKGNRTVDHWSYYNYYTNKLIVKPYNLSPGEKFKVYIIFQVKDIAGNRLDRNYLFEYTKPADPSINITSKSNGVQVRQESSYTLEWEQKMEYTGGYNVYLLKGTSKTLLRSNTKQFSYVWNVPKGQAKTKDYKFIVEATDKSMADTTDGYIEVLESSFGHDVTLKLFDLTKPFVRPGSSIKFKYAVENIGEFNESNFKVKATLRNASGSIIDDDEYLFSSLNKGVRTGNQDESIKTPSSLAVGFYYLTLTVDLPDDYAKGNNSITRSVYIGFGNPYSSYKRSTNSVIYKTGRNNSLGSTSYKFKFSFYQGDKVKVLFDGSTNPVVQERKHFGLYDSYKLNLIYDGKFSSTEASFRYAEATDEISFYPQSLTIEAGKTALIRVKDNEVDNKPGIRLYDSGDDDYDDVSDWRFDAFKIGSEDSVFYIEVTPPANETRKDFEFWVEEDGIYLQKLKVKVIDPIPDFTYSFGRNPISLAPGIVDSVKLTVDTLAGYSERIVLANSGAPNGVKVEITKNNLQAPFTTYIKFTVDDDFKNFGDTLINVSLTGATRTKEENFFFSVLDNSKNFISIDSLKYLDKDKKNDSLRIYYTGSFSLANTATTQGWQYLDINGNWQDIPGSQILNNSAKTQGSSSITWKIPANPKLQIRNSNFRMKQKNGSNYLSTVQTLSFSRSGPDPAITGTTFVNDKLIALNERGSKVVVETYDPDDNFKLISSRTLSQPPVDNEYQLIFANSRYYLFSGRREEVYYFSSSWSYLGKKTLHGETDAMLEMNGNLITYVNDHKDEHYLSLDKNCNTISGSKRKIPNGGYTGRADYGFSYQGNMYLGDGDDVIKISTDLKSFEEKSSGRNTEYGSVHNDHLYTSSESSTMRKISLYNPLSFYASSSTFDLNNTFKPAYVGKDTIRLIEDQEVDSSINLQSVLQDDDSPFANLEISLTAPTSLINGNLNYNRTRMILEPKPDSFGYGTLLLTASDGYNSFTKPIVIYVEPVNDKPRIASFSPIKFKEDSKNYLDYENLINDPDDEDLEVSFTIDDSYDGKVKLFNDTINGNLMVRSLNHYYNDSVPIKMIVEDDDGSKTELDFSIEIEPVNDAPLPFSRLTPIDSALWSNVDSIEFKWSSSKDIENDRLKYSLIISSELRDTIYAYDISDTNKLEDLAWLQDSFLTDTLYWAVLCTDSLLITDASNEEGIFYLPPSEFFKESKRDTICANESIDIEWWPTLYDDYSIWVSNDDGLSYNQISTNLGPDDTLVQFLVPDSNASYGLTFEARDVEGSIIDIIDEIKVGVVESPNLPDDTLLCVDDKINIELKIDSNYTSVLWENNTDSLNRKISAFGVYSIKVADSSGCSTIDSFKITAFPQPFILSKSIVEPKCFGEANGSILITMPSDSSNYSFKWKNISKHAHRKNISSGTYIVQIEDSNSCVIYDTTTLQEPDKLSVTYKKKDVICLGDDDGEIDLTTIGGTLPYTYLWNTGATKNTISNLAKGAYSVIIKDSFNCEVKDSINIVVVDSVKPTVLTKNISIYLDANGDASTNTTAIDNGSSDNCSISSLSLSMSSFDCSNVGANTVYLRVTDVNGNIDSASATVTVIDSVKPTVVTKNISVYLDANGDASTNTTAIDNGSSDNCSISSLSLSKSSFDCSNVGANTVYLRVTDVNGNIDSASATVTVIDSVKPTVVTKNISVYLDANGDASTNTTAIDNGSSDNCSISSLSLSKSSFDCSNVGANTVYLRVTDVNGNIDSASATVTVIDSVKPTVVTKNISVYLDANGDASTNTTAIDNGSSDNCSISSLSLSKSSFDCSNVGANTVYLRVTDVNGNIDSASATVTVIDSVKPTVVTKNISVYLDANGDASTNTTAIDNGSSDNCSISSLSLSKSSFDCSNVGANTVYLRVTDVNGNIDSASAIVTVIDSISPSFIQSPQDMIFGYCDSKVFFDYPKGTDNCSSVVTQVSGLESGEVFPVGVTTNKYIIEDPSGNRDSIKFSITIGAKYLPFELIDTSYCQNHKWVNLSRNEKYLSFDGVGIMQDGITFNPLRAHTGINQLYATFIDSFGCVTKDSFSVFILEVPSTPVIERISSNQLRVVEGNYRSYKWFLDGIEIPNARNQVFRVLRLGEYMVEVENIQGCIAVSDEKTFGFEYKSPEIIVETSFKVYPIPTSGILYVKFLDSIDMHQLELLDQTGKSLIIMETQEQVNRLDINHLSAGIYLLKVSSKAWTKTIQIIKRDE
jgi:hypothetical protein